MSYDWKKNCASAAGRIKMMKQTATVSPPNPDTLPAPAGSGRGAPLWLVIVAFIVLAGLLVLMGLGLARNGQTSIKVGDSAPVFNLTTFDGQTTPLASLKGKVVVVHFWASWCTSCFDEALLVEQAWQKYRPGGEVVFLGVDYVDTEGPALDFIKKYGFDFTNGPDLRGEISSAYHVTGVPETYIIDRQGNLAFIQPGPFSSLEEISGLVDNALKRSAGG
jgi:cytochrome c biogenesis protein CcmG, thiol:disulfide interchange protein DsbE